MIHLIGLWGYAGSGKDEAARALVADGWRREAFADRLRDMLYALNPIVDHEVRTHYPAGQLPRGEVTPARLASLVDTYGWERMKRTTPEVRELLQRLGTEAGRGVLGEDVWVNALMRAWRLDGRPPTVVTDMRFPNELRAIRDEDGLAVAILRRDYGPVNGHASETALADLGLFDHVIENDGSIDDLHAQVRALVKAPAVPSLGTVKDES